MNSFKETLIAFLGSIAWTIHFMLIYALAEFGCIRGSDWTKNIMVLLSFILFFLSFIAMIKCGKSYKQINRAKYPSSFFLMNFGVISNAIFSFIIIYQSIPIFYYEGRCL